MEVRRASRQGFTLVEVMVSMGILVFVLAAMISSFLVFTRGSLSVTNYSEMSNQSRKALELFSRDARNASSIKDVGSPKEEPNSDYPSYPFVYTEDALTFEFSGEVSMDPVKSVLTDKDAVYTISGGEFIRTQNGSSEVLLSGLKSMKIYFYQTPGTPVGVVTDDIDTVSGDKGNINTWAKSVKIDAELVRDVVTAENTDYIISARFMLRNF